ncbi:MAG: hypothetical protein OXF79_22405 [Chloroflexi bacterium]|nr:hypothetical protein [Chloroflexota bacterium]
MRDRLTQAVRDGTSWTQLRISAVAWACAHLVISAYPYPWGLAGVAVYISVFFALEYADRTTNRR